MVEKFERTKPHVNVGTVGHVDHGKSKGITVYVTKPDLAEEMKFVKVGETKLNIESVGEVGITVLEISAPPEKVKLELPNNKNRHSKHAMPWYKKERW